MASQAGAGGGRVPSKPFVVTVWEELERWHTLWADGGLEDQPHYLMLDLQIVSVLNPKRQ